MNKPIELGAHGAIDYAFTATNLLAASLLSLKGAARSRGDRADGR